MPPWSAEPSRKQNLLLTYSRFVQECESAYRYSRGTTHAEDCTVPFATRHRDDPMPALSPLAGLSVKRELNAAAMASLQDRSIEEMARRFDAGHRAYVALVDERPAAWGWMATRTADIG